MDKHAPIPNIPFDADAAPPVIIRAKARRVPAWQTAGGARGIAALPKSPLSSTEPLEDIVLVPYGATNIRVAVMPQLCDAGQPGCPPPPPPPPPPAPGCNPPAGESPPNMQLGLNLPSEQLPHIPMSCLTLAAHFQLFDDD